MTHQIPTEVMEAVGREYVTLVPIQSEARVVIGWAEK